jgi:MFS family permease
MGQGLTLSLFVVYLHNVRGFSTDFATLLLSAAALVGIASSPIWGSLTDRLGPIRVIMIAVFADAASLILWAHAHSETQATIAALLLALFGGAGWGPSSTLLSRMVAPEHRQRAFGFNFMLVNLGIGFGGLVSASVVNLHDPNSFVMLYTFNAGVTFFGRTHRAHPAPVRRTDQGVARRSRQARRRVGAWCCVIAGSVVTCSPPSS